MVVREELGGGSFKLTTETGSVLWTLHAPRVVEGRYKGFASPELVEPVMADMARVLDAVDGVCCFSDLMEIEGYDPELWKSAQAWLSTHRRRMAGNYILQSSSVVAVGTKLINLFSANTLVTFTKRPEYAKKLRECLKQLG